MTGLFERGTQTWRYIAVHRVEAVQHARVVTGLGCLLVAGPLVTQLALILLHSTPSPAVFWGTLIIEIAGFILIFRGLWEWRRLAPGPERPHRFRWILARLLTNAVVFAGLGFERKFRRVREKYLLRWAFAMTAAGSLFAVATHQLEVASRRKRPRRFPTRGLVLFGAGTFGTAVLDVALGEVGTGSTPFPIVWLVGGLVVLLFVGFFQQIRSVADSGQGRAVRILGLSAVVWGFGASVVSGLIIGHLSIPLLVNFFSDWVALGPLAASVVLSLSPLFVGYAILGAALLLSANRSISRLAVDRLVGADLRLARHGVDPRSQPPTRVTRRTL